MSQKNNFETFDSFFFPLNFPHSPLIPPDYFQHTTESTAWKSHLPRHPLPQLLRSLSFHPHLLPHHPLTPLPLHTSHPPHPLRSCVSCFLGDLEPEKAQLAMSYWGGRSLNRIQKALQQSLRSVRNRKRWLNADGYVQQMFCVTLKH